MRKFDVIVDLQFGSTGKGAIAGYLASKNDYDMVMSANMPNAGHTFIDMNGSKMVHKVLPSGIASSTNIAMIAPAAVFSMEQLNKELDALEVAGYKDKRVYIHEHAIILTPDHKNEESMARTGSTDFNSLQSIGSTQQGSAAALIDKLRRDVSHNPTVGHRYGLGYLAVSGYRAFVLTHSQYLEQFRRSNRVLIEGSQGYSLGLNAGFYPYCTSRDCTTARLLADCLVPPTDINTVIGTARTYPIRVGGTSGPGYEDQKELSWEQIGQPEERTTVTNRVRRVFEFSELQIAEAIQQSAPTDIFLNFCNYQTPAENKAMVHRINELCQHINKFGRVSYLGHGPTVTDIEELSNDN